MNNDKERSAMEHELVLCLASDEITRDSLGNWHWGERPDGPLIGGHAIDLLHALGALPMHCEEGL